MDYIINFPADYKRPLLPWKGRWIKALKSGLYEQGQNKLYKDGKYCCLGVLAKIQGILNIEGDDAGLSSGPSFSALNTLGYLPQGVSVSLNGKDYVCLSALNDNGLSFIEISDIIHEVWDEDFASIEDIGQRRLAFYEDTEREYSKEGRAAIEGDSCVYSAIGTSKGCAIGRFLKPEDANNLDTEHPGLMIHKILLNNMLKGMIPDWMSEMGAQFLSLIQDYHDSLDMPDALLCIKKEIKEFLNIPIDE